MQAQCPKCQSDFTEFKLKDSHVLFDLCLLCHATWFDKDEFWSALKNKEAKKQFKKQGLLNKKRTSYPCPKCSTPNTFLQEGTLPMTQITVEHCDFCESFLFDNKEFHEAKAQIDSQSHVITKATLNQNHSTKSLEQNNNLFKQPNPTTLNQNHSTKSLEQNNNPFKQPNPTTLNQNNSTKSLEQNSNPFKQPNPTTLNQNNSTKSLEQNSNPFKQPNPTTLNQNNLTQVQKNDFSFKIFQKRLKNLNQQVYNFTKNHEKPPKGQSFKNSLFRIKKSFHFIFKEPEIILFSFLQLLAIFVAYLVFIKTLDWIPKESWEQARSNSEQSAQLEWFLFVGAFVAVGFASIFIGFFTACIGASHILTRLGQKSTVLTCIQFVFPKIWSLWIFSWIDAWITTNQVLSRLNRNRDSVALRTFEEAMYYAWKIGTAGIIPGLLTTNNTWTSCKNSIGFLKHKTREVLELRIGYSLVNWIVGLCCVLGFYPITRFFILNFDFIKEKTVDSQTSDAFFIMGIPFLLAVVCVQMFVRPFYIISLFDLYSEYLIETKQKVIIPKKTNWAYIAIITFILLLLFIFFSFLFYENKEL